VTLDVLLPECRSAAVDEVYGNLDLAARAPADRPYVVLNMVESLDGRTTIGGHVGSLTSAIDQQIVYQLRTQAEALLVGAGTVRNERYANLMPPGVGPQPLVVIVTATVDLPRDLPLLQEPDTRIVIATPADATLGFDHLAQVEYLRVPGEGGSADCGALCAELRSEYGIRSVVCEGGPSLNESLLAADVVDELFLSLAPLLVGGGERALVDAAPSQVPRRTRLVSAAASDGYLFLRYEV
jgi:riboflavin-specific deaminase-like protein